MWYSINRKNEQKLHKFEIYLVVPMMESVLECKRASKTDLLQYIEEKERAINEDALDDKQHILNVLEYALKRKTKIGNESRCLNSIVNEILNIETEAEIEHEISLYYRQKGQLEKKLGYVKEYDHPEQWKMMFKDFFYEKFFAFDGIWKRIDGEKYTREDFHNNFKEDNELHVCPYCDTTTIIDVGNCEIEHFWPESRFPYLAVNPLNLFSSCKSCNGPAKGKGTNVLSPMVMPSYKTIGNDVRFRHNIVDRKIELEGIDVPTKNYIELLQLDKRYASKGVYNYFRDTTESIYESIYAAKMKGITVEDEDVKQYIRAKKEPMYFAISYVMSKTKNI